MISPQPNPILSQTKYHTKHKRKIIYGIGGVLLVLWIAAVMFYQTHKPLPQGLSMEGPIHHVSDDKIRFLYDLSYKGSGEKVHSEQMIFDRMFKAIEAAEQFIVVDMFLYNGYYDKEQSFPALSRILTEKLITQQTKHPNMQIIVIADEINTGYGSNAAKELELLEENGIETILSNVDPLRDSTPLYSAFWRTFIQWFGQAGKGWIADPLANTAPKMTLRSDLKLLNVKANHRKIVVTEKTLVVSTANAHDASYYNSNSAFEVQGDIIGDVLKSEQAAIQLSSSLKLPFYHPNGIEEGDNEVRLLTEGKTLLHVLKSMSEAKAGDTIWMGMFYLAERKVIHALLQASERGVIVNLILDPSMVAFGSDKIGIPNRPVAAELVEKSNNRINIRWYNTTEEQYHTKLMFVDMKNRAIIQNGSANYTSRNLDDLNLESNLEVATPPQSKLAQEVRQYFLRLWNNDGAEFTLDYSVYPDKMIFLKKVMYKFQGWLGFTTF